MRLKIRSLEIGRWVLASAFIILLFSFLPGWGQIFQVQQQSEAPKEQYGFIIIYRNLEQNSHYDYGTVSFSYRWITKIEGFRSWNDLISWLNSSSSIYYPADKQKRVRINKEELIAVYDLSHAVKVDMRLNTEDKVIKKHIKVDEEKWVDYEWGEEGKKSK